MFSRIFHRGSELGKYQWPNRQTVTSSVSVIVTIACVILKTSGRTTFIANLPCRIFNIATQHRNYSKVAFDVAALAALFFPYGQVASIAIDITSELVNFYHFKNQRDPMTQSLENSQDDQRPAYMRSVANAGSRVVGFMRDVPGRVQEVFSSIIFQPAVSNELRDFLDSQERMRVMEEEFKLPRPPMTEKEAREILDLPEEGEVKLSLARKNKEILIRASMGRHRRNTSSLEWFFEAGRKNIKDAYDFMITRVIRRDDQYDAWDRHTALVVHTGGNSTPEFFKKIQ